MIQLDIPGRGTLRLGHLVLDVNGTIAKDGRLLDKVAKPLAALRDRVTIHLLTADTYGRQDNIDLMLGLKAVRIPPGDEGRQKAAYVEQLGADGAVGGSGLDVAGAALQGDAAVGGLDAMRAADVADVDAAVGGVEIEAQDRKSTRLNSSH